MPKLNFKEAPPGFIAKRPELSLRGKRDSCASCYFFEQVPPLMYRSRLCPKNPSCLAEDRLDRCDVIYVKDPNYKEKPCQS